MDKNEIERAGSILRDVARSGSLDECRAVLGCVSEVLNQVRSNIDVVPKNARHTLDLANYGVVYTLRIVMQGDAS